MRSRSSYLFFIIFFWALQASWAQTHEIDSLRQKLKQAMPDTSRVMLLNVLARTIYKIDAQESLPTFEQALRLALKNNFAKGLVRSHSGLGTAYMILGNYLKYMEHYQKTTYWAEEIKDEITIAHTYNNVSNLYYEIGDNVLEMTYLYKALAIYEKYNTPTVQIAKSNVLNNLGNYYTNAQKYDSATFFLQKAYQLRKQYQPQKLASVLNYLAQLAYAQKDYRLAYQYFEEAFKQKEGFMYAHQKYNAMVEFALCLVELDSLNKATYFARKALQEAEAHKLPHTKRNAHKALATIYGKQKDFENAFRHSQLTFQLQDTLQNDQKLKELAKIQIGIYRQKKEWEHQQLQEKHIQQRYWLWVSIGTSLVVLVLLLYAVYLYLKRKNAYHTIAKQALDLQKASAEIASLNQELAQIVLEQDKSIAHKNQKLDEYLFLNAHKVRSPLATLLGLVQLIQNHQYDSQEELFFFVEQIHKSALKLDAILFEMNDLLNEGFEK
jgi:uncharacterized protein YpmB